MKYKLKPGVESFEVVDGEFAGKKFLRGKVYEKIPQEEAKKFEKTRDQKLEVRDQRLEVGGQGPEVGNQRLEVGNQRSEVIKDRL